jgi:hypothetical protein
MTNFIVKQNVQGLDDQLNAVRKKTVAEQKAIHELTADWTFLNQPELLTDLNNRYVHLATRSPKQVVTSLDNIPLRPAPSPALDAAPQIAEGSNAPAPTPPAKVVAAAPARPAIVPVSAVAPGRARVASEMVASSQPAKPASLTGLFAQVSGDR